MKFCRVCLAMNVRMYHMTQSLKDMYAQVIKIKAEDEHKMPQQLCWECLARLRSANKFIEKALKSQNLVMDKSHDNTLLIRIAENRVISTLVTKMIYDNEDVINCVHGEDNVSNINDDSDQDNFNVQLKTEDSIEICEELPMISETDVEIKNDDIDDNDDISSSSKVTPTTPQKKMTNDLLVEMKDLRVVVEKRNLNIQTAQVNPDDVTSNKRRLRKRDNRNDPALQMKFTCGICKKQFCSNYSLKQHMQKHPSTAVSYKCSRCPFTCHSIRIHKYHIYAEHIKRSKEKVLKCSKCSYQCFDKLSLKQHMDAKHYNSLIYHCPDCTYQTFHKNNLKSHINGKHTKTKIFKCYFCRYTSYYNSSLCAHMRTKHS